MLYRELTTIVPFYLNDVNQNRFKENAKKACEPQRLISPKDEFLPFMIELNCKKKLTKWLIKDTNGSTILNLQSELDKIKGYEFSDGKVYAYFFGGRLQTLQLNASLMSASARHKKTIILIGQYYHELTFGDITYTSELITFLNKTAVEMENEFMRIEFRSKVNINSLRYVPEFRQLVWLDTFTHTSRVEYEEEGEQDGENRFIPTFQTMRIIYENEIITNDFLKNAIHTLKLHDEILVSYKDERYGTIEGVLVESESNTDGALHNVRFDFICKLLTKSGCSAQVINDDFFNSIFVEDMEIIVKANTNTFVEMNYSFTDEIEEVEITEYGASALNFVNPLQLEVFPQPFFTGIDEFKMRITAVDGRISNIFSVKINVIED